MQGKKGIINSIGWPLNPGSPGCCYLSQSLFGKISSTNLYSQSILARELKRGFTSRHLSCIRCHISCVICHMSCVICHLSHVMCHVFFHLLLFSNKVVKLVSIVCYQRGLPRLVICGSLPAEKPGHVGLTFLHYFSL